MAACNLWSSMTMFIYLTDCGSNFIGGGMVMGISPRVHCVQV